MVEAPHFLVFGEEQNDQLALKNLIPAILELERVSVAIRRSPVILSRSAVRKRASMAVEIATFSRAEAKRVNKRVVVVAHRDCDACEPAHITEAKSLVDAIMGAGVIEVVAATPAWEIETWWMLFPTALAATRRCWRQVNYGNKNLGSIANSKEQLIRDLRPISKNNQNRCRDYAEVDGISVSKLILEKKLMTGFMHTKCASFQAFCEEIKKIVLPKPKGAVASASNG